MDYNKDIQKSKIEKAEVLYVQNKDNSIFRLNYRYKIGTLNDSRQALATQYIQFLGTDTMTAEQISKAFYKIACSFNISSGEEYTTVSIEGLQENFEKAVQLYEEVISNAKADEKALTALKARIAKSRKDVKANKNAILQGLTSYATYGPVNKFNSILTTAELESLTTEDLMSRLKNMNNYEQTIIYYGPAPLATVVKQIKGLHKVPASFTATPASKVFKPLVQTQNQVFFTNYDMVQAETRWVRNTETYDANKNAIITVFNNYFGDIVFQTIRESKALAYSTYGYYVEPQKKDEYYRVLNYVGSQADKFKEASIAMNELLNNLPELSENLNLAKGQVKKDIQTERITQDNIIFNYLAAKQLGLKEDIRKKTFSTVEQISMNDLKTFHNNFIANKPYSYAIVASENKIDMNEMKKLGEIKKVSLEEIFGF